MSYKQIIIISSLLTNLLFCNSEALTASQSSIIPFQLIPNTNPIIHTGILWHSIDIQPISGMQIRPTRNLLVGGLLSTRKIDSDISIYYQILIGYIPKWKILQISSNIIQIGIHQHQFSNSSNSKWISLSLSESGKIGNLKLNLCWSKLFNKKWERNTILLSTKIKLIKNIFLQPGSIAHFTPKFDYSPFLILSITL